MPIGPRDLASAVDGHDPIDDGESLQIARRALRAERPMWDRTEFDPGHFTASAFVIAPDRRSVLLIHHARLQRWLQPGGHIEASDTSLEAAARREVAEETGVTAMTRLGSGVLRIDAHHIPERAPEPAHVHIDLALGFRALDGAIGPIEEVLDARWVAIDELARYDVDDAVTSGVARALSVVD